MRRTLVTAVLLLSVLPWAGCGGGADGGTTGGATAADTSFRSVDRLTRGRTLLEEWDRELVPTLVLLGERAQAADAGEVEKAAKLEQDAIVRLRRILRFGRQGRSAFIDDLDSAEAKAVRAAGDAWTEWARLTLTDPPAGDFTKARAIADLGAAAVSAHREAYRALGLPVPAEFGGG